MNCLRRSYLSVPLIAFCVSFSFGQQQTDPLAEADQFFGNREYSRALEVYKKLFDETADIPTKVRIKLNIGRTSRMMKQYDLSIESFKEAATLESDGGQGSKTPRFRLYSHSADWEISKSLYAKGDYESALAVFRSFRAKPQISSGCGTCNESIERDKNITEGIYLEAAGRYKEAVIPYLRADEPHLAELYFKAGQLEDLREIVEKNITDLMQKHSWQRYYAIENSPYRNLIASIYAFDLEKTGSWQDLIKLAYRRDRRFGRNSIPAIILARNADKILPLLRERIPAHTLVYENGIIYEILALSGKVESLALLKELISKTGTGHEGLYLLIQAYKQANEKVKKQLVELEPFAKPYPLAQFLLERDDVDEYGRFEIKFPRIGEIPRLPTAGEMPQQLP